MDHNIVKDWLVTKIIKVVYIMLNLPLCIMQKARLARDARFDGLFFIGVKSTGIFCRTICKARMPQEKNVTYYENPIAAMNNGFRPCLMCRPDSAPGSYAWKGVETTVERGVKLINVHLSLNINEIADKLGISTRYFNKLFEQHLYVSPKRYQLLTRLLFAKQLLHESCLPIEQVAQASGFNAAKPLQHHMKVTTGLTPSQIRRFTTLKSQAKSTNVTVYLCYRPPYQWQHIRDFYKLREIGANEKIGENSICKVLRLGDSHVLFNALHQSQNNRFEVTFSLVDLRLLKGSIAAVKKMLDLNCEPEAIYDSLVDAGLPSSLILNGLRLPGVIDKFEAGCRAIVGQQVTVKAAIGQLNLLQNTLNTKQVLECDNASIELFVAQQKCHLKSECNLNSECHIKSNEAQSNPSVLNVFVSPKQVAQADLSFLKMPQARKNTLKAFAQFMLEKPQACIQEWLNIKGIGMWTVNYVTMRNSESPDIFLATDLVIKNQIKKLAEQEINIIQEAAAPWRSYLTLSLWNLSSGILNTKINKVS
ncbi:MAG: AraC family transcriptional regulator of adaptative response / DNA-3-methyladenine glycosylase II [Glaciecola sp.]|jgi:AraC family transcriptional regulator of adaptative response / DNA-3-methyladenine glycosylase II